MAEFRIVKGVVEDPSICNAIFDAGLIVVVPVIVPPTVLKKLPSRIDALTKDVVAMLFELSLVACVVAVVPLGRAGVPLRFSAVTADVAKVDVAAFPVVS
jgi:hypothetical protein